MPTCAFDDVLSEVPKFYDCGGDGVCYGTDSFGFFSDDRKTAADWFGPLNDVYPAKPFLFGGLDPKRPNYCPIPAGAVFDYWEDRYECGVSSFVGSHSGVGSPEIKADDQKALPPDTKEPVADKKLYDQPGEMHVNEKKNSLNVEKKKRGRPRLELAQARQQQRAEKHIAPLDLVNFNLSAYALTDRPSALYNYSEDDLVTVGRYSKAVRRRKIQRFKEKKRRTLEHGTLERYGMRKKFADSRPRVGGRFIKLANWNGPLNPRAWKNRKALGSLLVPREASEQLQFDVSPFDVEKWQEGIT
jgi:hypothetical protein